MAKRNPIDQIEWMRNLLAFLLVGAFVSILAALMLVSIPDSNKDITTYMVGQLSGMALTVLGFYFINKVGDDALAAKRADNTGKVVELAATAMKASTDTSGAVEAADEVAGAAIDKADEIKGNVP